MRAFQQRQILLELKKLHTLHQKLQAFLVCRDPEAARGLLGECQEIAIVTGEMIEELQGSNTKSVAMLEEYCEELYQASLVTDVEGRAAWIFETLERSVERAECEIGSIKTKKEVVFFPYKASMWDSMESVYRAAAKDPDCDAYVVPIPFFVKKPDGSFGEMFCEGNEYPGDIPIYSWKDYDAERRRPDAVFVHNPYDNCNQVSSVHPDFYCKTLRKFTKLLVYIPYFVLEEREAAETVWREAVEDFCLLPGTIYADRVILQSERIRRIYAEVYQREFKKRGIAISSAELKDKFYAYGSPKYDKLLERVDNGDNLLTEWAAIVRKPDGSLKKIILYNTGIKALLKYREKMLDKIEETFCIAKNSREDIALLWRPHPLYRSTVASALPELLNRYDKLVEGYKKGGWGIYDDSTDMYRAIRLSDAYYGDGSSLVQICKRLGKCVVIQSVY